MTNLDVFSAELERIMSSKSSHTDAWCHWCETAPTVSPWEPVYLSFQRISESLSPPSISSYKIINWVSWRWKEERSLIKCLFCHVDKSERLCMTPSCGAAITRAFYKNHEHSRTSDISVSDCSTSIIITQIHYNMTYNTACIARFPS